MLTSSDVPLARRPGASLVVLASFGALLAGCGSDLQLPPPSPNAAAKLALVDGDAQHGVVGQALPAEVVIEVTDAAGTPVPDAKVAFVPTGGGGQVSPDTATSAADGRVRARWVLGTASGRQAAEARLVASGQVAATAVVTASALPDAATQIVEVSGNHQPGLPFQRLPDSLVVQVVDRYHNPVPGVNVDWEVTRGGGGLSGSTVPSGADGHSAVTWTLGFTLGRQQVTATAAGLQGSPVRFDVGG